MRDGTLCENSIEAAPAAYIVGGGQKVTLKNADASRTVKQWVVDFGNGTTETYNGNTAAFTSMPQEYRHRDGGVCRARLFPPRLTRNPLIPIPLSLR